MNGLNFVSNHRYSPAFEKAPLLIICAPDFGV